MHRQLWFAWVTSLKTINFVRRWNEKCVSCVLPVLIYEMKLAILTKNSVKKLKTTLTSIKKKIARCDLERYAKKHNKRMNYTFNYLATQNNKSIRRLVPTSKKYKNLERNWEGIWQTIDKQKLKKKKRNTFLCKQNHLQCKMQLAGRFENLTSCWFQDVPVF